MGNYQPEYTEYNKLEDPLNPIKGDTFGPMIATSVDNFSHDIEEKYKNKTMIETAMSNLKSDNFEFLGYRKFDKIKEDKPTYEEKFTYFSSGEVYKMIENTSKNLHEKEELIKNDTYDGKEYRLIGLFAKNCAEWVITDYACQLDSITTVTLYLTLGEEAFKYICDLTQISTVCVSPDLVDTLVSYKKNFVLENLKNVIVFDMTTYCKDFSELFSKLKNVGFNTLSFKNDIIKENLNDIKLNISKADTIMTICFTSGTTGNPKGVMLNQRNLISLVECVIKDSRVPLHRNSVHFSYLPLAHIFERMMIGGMFVTMCKIGFITGTFRDTMMNDLRILKPTLLCAVPKVLLTIRKLLFQKIAEKGKLVNRLFRLALSSKLNYLRNQSIISHPLYDALIFKEIRANLGGRLETILCGGAPLARELAAEFRVLLSTSVQEGFGMTELAGSALATSWTDLICETAGGVVGCAKMVLKSVPELNYFVTDKSEQDESTPSGEMCISGPCVFVGYYKNPEETKKVFDEDGYFHTGDVGRVYYKCKNGIRIIDRIKEIFKLSQGEFIVPVKLENVYEKSNYVDQICIYGNSHENHIIAIVKPNIKMCCKYLNCTEEDLKNMENNYINKDNNNSINKSNNNNVYNLILDDFAKLATEAKFNGLEKVHHLILSFDGFTIENKMLTPTNKYVRKNIEKTFEKQINNIYHKNNH